MNRNFIKVCGCFGSEISSAAEKYGDICEIRIRAEKPVVIIINKNQYFLKSDGNISQNFDLDNFVISAENLRSGFSRMCSYSVYKHITNINQGFVTLEGGHRVGVCGSAVCDGEQIRSVNDVTSVNIRKAGEFVGCADMIFGNVGVDDGLLICGSPMSGKTTILRDIARTLSLIRMKKVSLIDERLELASTIGSFDVGLCDVYRGYPKTLAITLAVRTMSPEFVICDELTGENVESIVNAVNNGVRVISSVHCDSAESARKNPSVRSLMKSGAFGRIIFLDGEIPANIAESYNVGELNLD